MPAYRIKQFAGQIPKTDPREIPLNAAQDATNVFLTSGRIDPMNKPLQITTTRSHHVQTIYRMFDLENEYWLNWDEQVDVAESPVYVANNSRIAYSSPDFEPRQTDMTLARGTPPYPTNNYVLGVTPPVTKPSVVSVLGGSGNLENRSYVYTFVTQWGEESAPSPAMDIYEGPLDATWSISVPDVAPSNSYNITNAVASGSTVIVTADSVFGLRAKETITIVGVAGMVEINGTFRIAAVDATAKTFTLNVSSQNLYLSGGVASREAPHNTNSMQKRIYRTVTTSTGTDYYQVGEDVYAGTTVFVDNFKEVGSPLVTTGWAMPPADLEGLVTHSSGAMVGFVGNQLYMSVPYSIYAWPISQVSTIDYNIVGLGMFAQTVVVLTEGRPYIFTFTDPEAATAQKLDKNWPCLSKRGITTFNAGVYYPTNIGLVYIGAQGMSLISEDYFAQRDWQKLNPSSFIAGHYDDRYYAAYTTSEGIRIMLFAKADGITFLNLHPTAMYTDRKSGELYIAETGFVKQLNASYGLLIPYSWKSKEFVEPNPVNLGACKVDFIGSVDPAIADAIAKQNATITAENTALLSGNTLGEVNSAPLNTYKAGGSVLTDLISAGVGGYYVSISLYVNGELKFTKKVNDSSIWRFPAGYKYDNYSIGITGTAPVRAVVIGGTPMELKNA